MVYDLIIVGGGPGGVTAGIYSARKKLKTLLLAEELQGQSAVSAEIQNWIGEISISGSDLAKKMEKHLRTYEGEFLEIKTGMSVVSVSGQAGQFKIETKDGESYESKSVLIASGGRRRKLDVKGADIFEHKGLTYCASCDGPLFSGQDVVVIGGGNAGFGTANQLIAYCKSVILLETASQFRAEQITIDKIAQNYNFKMINNVELVEVKGEKFVSSLVYKNKSDNQITELPVTGIFIEIGFAPNTELVKNLVKLNPKSEIIVDHNTQQTSLPGLWAVGDCADNLYHQNNIAVGDAVKAVEDIYLQLR